MKNISDALRALLMTGQFVLADLYTITMVGGGTIRLTTNDRDVVISGQTYVSTGPYVDVASGGGRGQKSTSHQKIGLDVDTKTVSIQPRPKDPISGVPFPDKIGGQPWLAAIAGGAFDGAELQMDRAYWSSWAPVNQPLGAPTGIISALFSGRVAGLAFDRGIVTLTVNSHLELLTQQIPRNFYGPPCRHTLFDPGCGLVASAFGAAGTLSSVVSRSVVVSGVAATGSGSYRLGRILFTNGLNAGTARMVRDWAAATGQFSLIAPLPFAAQVGDAFLAYPGCDKAQSTCRAFGNLANFGGQPFIPSIETSV